MSARWELPLRRDQVLRIVKTVGAGEEAQFVRDAVDAALAWGMPVGVWGGRVLIVIGVLCGAAVGWVLHP